MRIKLDVTLNVAVTLRVTSQSGIKLPKTEILRRDESACQSAFAAQSLVTAESVLEQSRCSTMPHHSESDGDFVDSIGTTSNHPFWSVERQEYVQAGQLEIGERLQTLHGHTKTVVSNLPRPGPKTDVYNLEVHAEHTYFVGKDGVLVHNSYERRTSSTTGNILELRPSKGGMGPNRWQRLRTDGAVVIGETMARVEARAAKLRRAVILDNMPDFNGRGLADYEITAQMMQFNRRWILEQIRSGRQLIDIGVDARRKIPSIFYQMEQNMIRNYQKLNPAFRGATKQ